MDVHVHRAITDGLRLRDVHVVTAQKDGRRTAFDSDLLDRATKLGLALFSQDEDLLAEAKHRQIESVHFGDVIQRHQLRVTIGQCVNDLEIIAKACIPEDMAN